MKAVYFLLLLGAFLTVSSSRRGEFFQVVTSHPHDIKKLTPYIETTHRNGRLWIVKLKVQAPENLRKYLRPVSGEERSYHYEPSNKNGFSSLIKRKVEEVEIENIRRDVEELSSFRTRAAGTADNRKAVQLVQDRFKELGYEVQLICYKKDVCSVIADKKGKTKNGKVLLVMGHIDSVGKDFAGADDNASGTAVLLEMARVLKNYANKNTLRFFVTNGEELGLLGAHHYVKTLGEENRLQELALAINMDMVGFNEKNNIVELETAPEFKDLAHWFAELASRYTTLKTKVTLGAWGSDHVPFLNKGVPALLTIENWDTKTPCYHQACDKPETLNYEFAAEIGKLNTSAVLTKDSGR